MKRFEGAVLFLLKYFTHAGADHQSIEYRDQ